MRSGTVTVLSALACVIGSAAIEPSIAFAQIDTFEDKDSRLTGNHACERDRIAVPVSAADPSTPLDELPVELEADEIEVESKNIVILRGNAFAVQGRQKISADELRYQRDEDLLTATGNVVLFTPSGDRLETDTIEVVLSTLTGSAGKTGYRLADREDGARSSSDRESISESVREGVEDEATQPASQEDNDQTSPAPKVGPGEVIVRARGQAARVFFEGQDSLRMEDVTYTTCLEGSDDVVVTARQLRLDQATGTGTARGLGVRLGNVPVFYFPYMTFPITDERKTGLLTPGVGTAKDSGFILQLPWYWNIAPNLDATITPRILTDRGLQLAGEFRYLGNAFDGRLRGEYLPSDDLSDDDRSALSFQHFHDFTDRLSGRVDFQHISDEAYLDDLENDLQISSATHLPQTAQLFYRGDILSITGRVSAYQTIDESIAEANRPYDRLPQIIANGSKTIAGGNLRFGLDSELVNFDRDEGLTGWRFDATPYVSAPLRRVYGFVTPKIALRHTNYSLDGVAAGQDDSVSRTVPVTSIDSGLFFDRETSFAGSPHTQTLEPRLFFLHVPEEDQNDLPNFDTAEVDLNNFSNIFRENRFFGADRVGDTQQLTLGLTSRLLDTETGEERFRGSIGQVVFFDDRTVSLDGTVDERDTSDFLGEFRAQLPSSWDLYGFAQYDTDESELRHWRVNAEYNPTARKRVRLGYVDFSDTNEQVDLLVRWPLADRWDFGLEERYSVSNSESVQTTLRLGYDACCWSVDVALQRRLDRDQDYRNAFFVTLELKGLTRLRAGL